MMYLREERLVGGVRKCVLSAGSDVASCTASSSPVCLKAISDVSFGIEVTPAMRAGGNGSIWPGIQNLLLAARAMGLGAAPTTLALMDTEAVAGALSLPNTMAAYCLIPVGYPLGKFGPVTRKPLEEITRFDQWS